MYNHQQLQKRIRKSMGVRLYKVWIWLIKVNTYVIYFLLICKLLSPHIRESSNSSPAPLLFLQMNVLLAPSRGCDLKDLTPKEVPLTARVISGGSLKKLNSIAKSSPSIASPRFSTTPTHVYIMAGIPDITEKLHGPHNYTEYIYNNTPQSTIQNIKNDMQEIANTIISRGAKPIFGTIAPINILKYNTFLKEKCKTSMLKHTHQYDELYTGTTYTTAFTQHSTLNKNG